MHEMRPPSLNYTSMSPLRKRIGPTSEVRNGFQYPVKQTHTCYQAVTCHFLRAGRPLQVYAEKDPPQAERSRQADVEEDLRQGRVVVVVVRRCSRGHSVARGEPQ